MSVSDYTHYANTRSNHWDNVSTHKQNKNRLGAFYQKLIEYLYCFLILKNKKILEIGCGHGDLLAALKPSFGVGLDFSSEMIKHASYKHPNLHFVQADAHHLPFNEKFDVIILSDLVNDLWDVQSVLAQLKNVVHPDTRIIINCFSNLWRVPLTIANRLGLGSFTLEQNWLTPHDVLNLLHLENVELIKMQPQILFPFDIPLISTFFNRYLVKLIPFSWFSLTNFYIARPMMGQIENKQFTVSVIVPARNEAGNIEAIIQRIPALGSQTEIIFVEGNSTDNTYETIQQTMSNYPDKQCKLYKQTGKGKGDAVRRGFSEANGDILLILDADLTVPPEVLPRFIEPLVSGKGEFINGVRLVYPMEDQAMRFFNMIGNKFFSMAFSWLLGQPIKDTLCGTKVLLKKNYETIAENRSYFGDFDPFGDFDLLFGASKLHYKIVEIPIRYRSRTYGETNIQRWRHGWQLLKMVIFAAKRIKFI
ncbi:MAG: glycosyltransferase [Desulfobacterales bacterium]|nr:glycosyltransferase [Desulfobacterales bacterium]